MRCALRKRLEEVDAFVYIYRDKSPGFHACGSSYNGGICSVPVYRASRRKTITGERVVDVSKKELPERWAKRLIEKGFTDSRFSHDVASMGALSTKTGVHTSTISAAIHGKGKPSIETVRMLVQELGADVADWIGVTLPEPFQVPAEADLLTPRQRKAVVELIRSIVADEQKEGGGGHGNRSASTKKLRPSVVKFREATGASIGQPEGTRTPPDDAAR